MRPRQVIPASFFRRSTDFGRQARSTAEALRSTSEQLRGQGQVSLSKLPSAKETAQEQGQELPSSASEKVEKTRQDGGGVGSAA